MVLHDNCNRRNCRATSSATATFIAHHRDWQGLAHFLAHVASIRMGWLDNEFRRAFSRRYVLPHFFFIGLSIDGKY